MVISTARDHSATVGNDLVGAEKCAIHPATSLLHEHSQALRAVREGLGIWDVLHGVARLLLDVDLEAHDTIFGKILVGFGASRGLVASYVLEEFVEGCSLDGLPTENTVRARQHRCEAEEGLSCFVRRMAKLILVELGRLDHVRGAASLRAEFDLDFTADTTCLGVLLHEVVKLLNGVQIGARSNIKQQAVLRLKILADGLEEPLMRIDLSIVALLNTEHEVDTSPLEDVLLNAKVPRGHLEAMQQVRGNFRRVAVRIHDVTNVFHLELVVTVDIHEALLEKDLLVEEFLFTRQNLEACGDPVVAIDNAHNEEVILGEVGLGVQFERVVVVQAATQRAPQLILILVVHRDADGQLGVLLSDATARSDLRDHARVLDLSVTATGAETGRSKLLVKRRRRQHQRLVRHIDGRLPLLLLLEGHPTVVRLGEHVVIVVAASAHFVVFVDAVALDKEVFPGVAVVLEVRLLLDGFRLIPTNVSGWID